MKYNTIIALITLGLIGMIVLYFVKTNRLKRKISKLERMLQAHLIEKGE